MSKRLIVDGIEFSQIVQFPRILTAVTSALQPSRLLIGLAVVTALVAVGRLWDNATPPRVHPQGLAFGSWDAEQDGRLLQLALRDALNGFAVDKPSLSEAASQQDLDARDVLARIKEGHRINRESRHEGAERDQYDRQYEATVALIDQARPKGAFEASAMHVASCVQSMVSGVLAIDPAQVVGSTTRLLVDTPRLLWGHQRWFVIIYGLWFVAVLSIGGGAVARMQALQTAAQRRIRMREAVDFALAGWGRLVMAQVLPLVLAGLVAVVLAVLALPMLIPVGDILAGLTYGLALGLGFLIAFLLIGFALSFPLLVPAVACENGDGPDAMQRAFAYVVTRPLHLLFYWALALLGLALGFILASLFAAVTLNVTAAIFQAVSGHPAAETAGHFAMFDLSPNVRAASGSWHVRGTAWLLAFWQMLVVGLVAAYVVSYCFSAFTVVYLLMRLASDGQDIEEVWGPAPAPASQPVVPGPPANSDSRPGGEPAA